MHFFGTFALSTLKSPQSLFTLKAILKSLWYTTGIFLFASAVPASPMPDFPPIRQYDIIELVNTGSASISESRMPQLSAPQS
jgi:hypothetical protein